ncbi:MAG: hypothetical protein GX975_04280 [Clostridiales bacterium]|nr:hypothetical protein [Clostridiales bacterium]
MKKIKDLIYDYNDILLALLIIAVAGAVIMWRVNEIMAYPAYLQGIAQDNPAKDVDFTGIDLTQHPVDDFNTDPEDINVDVPPDGETPGGDPSTEPVQDPNAENPGTPSSGEKFVTAKDIEVTIPRGSTGAQIAEILLKNGAIDSSENFIATAEAKKKATKLQAGTFKIPAGSTVEDVVNIIAR